MLPPTMTEPSAEAAKAQVFSTPDTEPRLTMPPPASTGKRQNLRAPAVTHDHLAIARDAVSVTFTALRKKAEFDGASGLCPAKGLSSGARRISPTPSDDHFTVAGNSAGVDRFFRAGKGRATMPSACVQR